MPYQQAHIKTDIEIECKGCGEIFIFRECDWHYREDRTAPTYCPYCERKHREKLRLAQQEKMDIEWRIKKQKENEQYIEELKKWNTIPVSDIPDADDKRLCVIGNGFDLMHGVKSGYRDFGNSIGKRTYFMFCLQNYLFVEDLWGDFENALAQFDAETMCDTSLVDSKLEEMGAYDDEAGVAEFFAAAENAVSPMTTIAYELPKRFRKWVETLEVNTDDRPLEHIIKAGKVLNFNYTEFPETLYSVDPKNICYIHGCRKGLKNRPNEELVLGHLEGASDAAFDFKDHPPCKNRDENEYQMLYDARETALRFLVEADIALTKHTRDIIKNHIEFFRGLGTVDSIVIIGHSLYRVDWDYYKEILNSIYDIDNVIWYIGCFGIADLRRIDDFIDGLHIDKNNVRIFRTDVISVNIFGNEASNKTKTYNKSQQNKVLCQSDNNRWEVRLTDKKVQIIDRDIGGAALSRVFYSGVSGAFFDETETHLFLVIKGIYKGVFLFLLKNDRWKYVKELEGIPNQGVITARLKRIYQDGNCIRFVYSSRIREYNIENGELILNKAAQRAADRTYNGKDITAKLRNIYKEGFH